ncbi:MAG: alpha/beta fold hydrolase, partial [Solirubrobacterales bacterium]
MSESFRFDGHRVSYEVYGAGNRDLVLAHGLLMNRGMYARLGPELAARGNRVICVDLLGHGASDKPEDVSLYSMTSFADQIAALLDHRELETAVVGGTSLGANVGVEFGVRHPERARGLFLEMPVLDNALSAAAIAFTPVLALSQLGAPVLRITAALARMIPRSHYLVDIGLDWIRRDPDTSVRVLRGLLQGRLCPPASERSQITAPTLVIGHLSDPIHPFSDADGLV